MSQIPRYKPFRNDLPISLYTWLFFVATFFGFVLVSVVIGVGVFWGVLTSIVITFLSHSSWQSSVGAFLMKRFFAKSLIGFVIDIVRKRSVLKAAEDMISIDDNAEQEIDEFIQRQSRWLVIVPILLLAGTYILDLLIDASLRYFLIAELYYSIVGLFWMFLCRRGRLSMLPIESSV